MIGHELIRRQMLQSILSGRVSHAHIIVGEEGLGKSLVGREFALRILGKAKELNYVDIAEWRVKKDKLSIGAEEIREIIEEVNKKPYEGDKKVILVYQGEKLTEAAQNVFLKTIEEPPHGVYIILLCDNVETILDTVKSRCQMHKLQRLSYDEMEAYITKNLKDISQEEKRSIIYFSDGIPGRAERFKKDDKFKLIRDSTLDILKKVGDRDKIGGLELESFFKDNKDEWREVLTWMLSYIRDIMVYKETGENSLLLNNDKTEDIEHIAGMFSFNRLSAIIDIVNETSAFLKRNVNMALVYDRMIFKMVEV